MCGIAGICAEFSCQESATRAGALLKSMLAPMAHRGPDGAAVYVGAGIALGHVRLSIIDLAGGAQPMHNDDGSLSITFNGEIFNYLELRAQLEAEGVHFKTQSDTEVLLRLYERQGAACLHQLNGQWAFAVWHARDKRLFLARDRLGVRPLHYTRVAGAWLFASEIKSLLVHPQVERRVDLRALDELFTFWAPLSPRTLFEGIYELPPGHCMMVQSGQAKVWSYWQPDYAGAQASPRDADRCADELLDLLRDATRLRLRSDVPVGAYVSGGLDSTVVATLIRQLHNRPLETFSVTFEQDEFDERPFQQAVVRHLGTQHQEVLASCAAIGQIFAQVVWHAEKPMLRTAPAPLFLLAALVRRRGYKVVLTGEGSDEILGGYDIFKEAKIRRFWGRRIDSRWRPLLLKRLYPWLPQLQAQSPATLKEFFHVGAAELASPFFSHLPRWRLTAQIKQFFSADVVGTLAGYDAVAQYAACLPPHFFDWHPFCQAQYLETTHLLPGYILSTQGDRMSMGSSVEGRFPFLDHRVVDFAARLPPLLKMYVLDEKYLLKRAVSGLVCPEIVRRPKQPYRAPDMHSFFDPARGAARFSYVDHVLSPEAIKKAGLFCPGAVQKLVAKAKRGAALGARDNMAMVALVSTQLWTHQFLNSGGGGDFL